MGRSGVLAERQRLQAEVLRVKAEHAGLGFDLQAIMSSSAAAEAARAAEVEALREQLFQYEAEHAKVCHKREDYEERVSSELVEREVAWRTTAVSATQALAAAIARAKALEEAALEGTSGHDRGGARGE